VGLPLTGTGPRMIGRYALYEAFASGGMATVHLGRDLGAGGRTVAIKRLHAQFVNDPEFVTMFLDEARLAACVRHPNVVSMLDIVTLGNEPFLVMEYVQGESLSRLIRGTRERGMLIPGRVVGSIMTGALHGLHAAHDSRNERDELLGLIHRDVSPHNVLVGVDGYARMVDFGVAKAAGREQNTRAGQLKGKLSYMAPEQARFDIVNRQTDIYAAAVVMWEALTGQRLFYGETDGAILARVIEGRVEPPSQVVRMTQPNVDPATFFEIAALDPVVMCGLARDPARRFASAYDMAVAVERSLHLAPPAEVSAWVSSVASDQMQIRARRVMDLENGRDGHSDPGERDSEVGLAPVGVRSGQYAVQRTVAMPSPVQASAQFLQTLQMPPQAPPPFGQTIPLPTGSAPRVPDAAPSRPVPPQSNFDVRTGLTPSQLSSISVSTPSGIRAAPKPPRRWGLIGAFSAVAAFVLAAAILVGMGALKRRHARVAAQPPPATTTTTTQAPQPPPDPTPTTVAIPVVTAVPIPTPIPTPTPTQTLTPTPTPTPVATPTATPRPRPRRWPPVSDECKPPYTIDADGVRHYKPACL
jgi:eukaryotic-like serine/threonine-protein kinase